jgi:hypothetical protein
MRQSQQVGHKWIQNVEYEKFEAGKNISFSTYHPPALIHLSHRFTSECKPKAEKSFDCCFIHFRTQRLGKPAEYLAHLCMSLGEGFDPESLKYTA